MHKMKLTPLAVGLSSLLILVSPQSKADGFFYFSCSITPPQAVDNPGDPNVPEATNGHVERLPSCTFEHFFGGGNGEGLFGGGSPIAEGGGASVVAGDGDGDGKEGPCDGNPILIATGNKVESVVDYQGKGEFPLSISRTYNKNWTGTDLFGKHWVTNYGHKLTFTRNLTACPIDPNGAVPESCEQGGSPSLEPVAITAYRPGGLKILFTYDAANNQWVDKVEESINIIKENADGTWTFTTAGNFVETYNAIGKVTKRVNPEGISHSFSYINTNYSGGQLASVTHSSGRSLSLTWTGIGGTVSKITDSAGNQYDYALRTNASGSFLGTVTYPGTPAHTYDYYYNDLRFAGALTQISVDGIGYAYFEYHADGKGASSYHAGNVDRHDFSFAATSTEVTNPLGHTNKYTFEEIKGNRKLKKIDRYQASFCPAANANQTYDANGFADLETDWKGIVTDYDYNDEGKLQKTTYAKGTPEQKVETYTWIAGESRISQIQSADVRVNYLYTASGRTQSMTSTNLSAYGVAGEQRTVSYTYTNHANGIMASQVINGPRTDVNDIVTYNYDTKGNLTNVTNALGHMTTLSNYDALGNVGRITSANGLQTDFTYNPRGWLLTQTVAHPAGNQVTSYTYNAKGQPTHVYFPDGNKITNVYNNAFRLTKTYLGAINLGSQSYIKYDYNANGDVVSRKVQNKQVTSVPNPNCWGGGLVNNSLFGNNVASLGEGGGCEPIITETLTDYNAQFYEYDAMERLHSQIGNGGQKVEYIHDDNSNVKEAIDSYGRKTTYTHDSLNRVKTSTDPYGKITSYAYDAAGRVSSVTDARGLTTSYHYSGFGELESMTSPDTGTVSYDYNQSGQVVKMTRNSGQVSTFTYDVLGRIKTENHAGMVKTYYYDSGSASDNRKGRLYYVNDSSGQTHYFYDSVGNVTRKASRINGVWYNTYYAYDGMNRMSRITYPSGHKILYSYDALGRVGKLRYQSGSTIQDVVSNMKYRHFGPIKELTHGNGAVRAITHDLDYRPTKIETAGIQSLSYLFDKNDNITKITNGIVANNTQTYAYDYLNRLKTTTSNSGNHSYTYDEVGNRKTHTTSGLSETYQYANNSNQLEKVIANGVHNNIAYNANGHTQTKDSGTFNYNAENRMSSFVKNGQTTSFTYNALGQRASKSGPYGTNHYLYDEAGQLIAEHYSDGRVRKEYIYLHGEVIGFIAGSTPKLYYVHNDHLGRAERITDATKGTVWLANNHDFDRSIAQSIGDYNLGFPGQYFDKETGLYYNYFRDYDPKTGRYVQSDPIGLFDGPNTYAYVANNPLSFIDFYGLAKCGCMEQQQSSSPDGKKWNQRRTGPNGQDQVYRFGRWNPTYNSNGMQSVFIQNSGDFVIDSSINASTMKITTGSWGVSFAAAIVTFNFSALRSVSRHRAGYLQKNYSQVEINKLSDLQGKFAACVRAAAGGIDE